MAENVKKNYFYNLIYQMTAILLPLITMPYVSRRLGAKATGINAVTYANIQYFIFIGTLGISIYATKKIATIRDKRDKLKANFWEIFAIQFFGCIIAYIVYLLIFCLNSQYKWFYFLQGFFLIANSIDISWYFLGIENFKNASIRSLCVKVISVVLIFIFVKTPADLGKYIFINSFTMLLGQIVMWVYVDKDIIKLNNIKSLHPLKHLVPAFALFVPQIATQIYTVLDKTMLDLLGPDIKSVSYYDYSQKIIRILLAVLTSLGTVMLPKIANLYSQNEHDEVKIYLRKAFTVSTFLAVPMAFGIMGVSNRFIPMFFGVEFKPAAMLTAVSSVLIIIIGIGNVFGSQYLLATGKNKEYTKSVTAAAVINVICNIILIPKFGAIGAVLSTIAAEFTGAIIQFIYSKKIVDFTWVKATYKYWVSGLIMLAVVMLLGRSGASRIVIMTEQVIVGAAVYVGILLLIRDKFLIDTIKNIVEKIKVRK